MGLNEVFKKVSAINEVTELASQKVELKMSDYEGYISEVKNINNKISASAKLYKELYANINKSRQELIVFENKLRDISSESNSQYKEDSFAAKDLGLDMKPIDIKRKELSGIIYNSFQEIQKALNLR